MSFLGVTHEKMLYFSDYLMNCVQTLRIFFSTYSKSNLVKNHFNWLICLEALEQFFFIGVNNEKENKGKNGRCTVLNSMGACATD